MITELKLENWKSFQDATIHIDPLSVLIGTNASGKSNALDALQFLVRVASGAMLTSALQGDGAQTTLRGGVEWAARKPGNTFALVVIVRSDEATDYKYRVEVGVSDNRCELRSEQLIRIKYRVGKNGHRAGNASGQIQLFWTDRCENEAPTIIARLYNEKRGTPRQLSRNNTILFQLLGQKLRQEIEEGVTATMAPLREIFILDPIPSHMRNYSPLSEKLESDARNIAGVLSALPEQKRKETQEALTRYASRLPERDIRRVYAETVGKFNADAMLYCEEHWLDEGDPPPTVDARGMSDGTLRFLAILTALLTRPRGSLLVIEEVDNGLHSSRARLLLEVLQTVGKEQGVDVLVTTHNPALLDAMGTEMIPFIAIVHRDSSTGHSVVTELEELNPLAKLLAHGQVGRLASEGLLEKSLAEAAESRAKVSSGE